LGSKPLNIGHFGKLSTTPDMDSRLPKEVLAEATFPGSHFSDQNISYSPHSQLGFCLFQVAASKSMPRCHLNSVGKMSSSDDSNNSFKGTILGRIKEEKKFKTGFQKHRNPTT